MKLENTPGPEPSDVLLPDVVGPGDVLQHTPLAVMTSPPVPVILPPLMAVVWVMDDTSTVVNSARVAGFVVKLT